MKFGFSSYSFHQRLGRREMTVFEVIDWIADHGGEHLELAAIEDAADSPVPNLASPPEYLEQVVEHAAARGVVLSNLAVHADLSVPDGPERSATLDRLRSWVDLAQALGISRIRHDVVAHQAVPGDDVPVFEAVFGPIVEGCREIARYAAQAGITTSLENHGFFVQSSDRVRRIVLAVDEPNFRTTLDVGNFVCVDEDPVSAVTNNLPYASIVHFKDFYIRPATHPVGEGWFRSRGGRPLRGAIVGDGDLDLSGLAAAVKASGYDGFVSIEFEGVEDCLIGCRRGLENLRTAYAAA